MDPRRSSLDSGTKLDGLRRSHWRLSVYPEAGEAGGSVHSVGLLQQTARGGYLPGGGSAEVAHRRARGKLRRYCAANRLNRLGTLTYAGRGCHDPKRLRQDVARFFRRLRERTGRDLPYAWVPEWHPGGHGLHVHFVVGRYFVHYGAIREAWGHGFIDIRHLSDLPVGSGVRGEARLAARYLSEVPRQGLRASGWLRAPSVRGRPGLPAADADRPGVDPGGRARRSVDPGRRAAGGCLALGRGRGLGRSAGAVGDLDMRKPDVPAAVRAWVERTCAAQGLPVKVTDHAALAAVATLLGQTRQTGSIRSGSKRARPGVAGLTTARSRTAATTARWRDSGSDPQAARSVSDEPM